VFELVVEVVAGSANQDRAVVVPHDGGVVVALADGAGGTGNGAAAADAIVEAVTRVPGLDPVMLLEKLDERLVQLGGQSTAVVIAINGEELRGASVGDSGAWLIDGANAVDVTAGQQRKPLLGDGAIVMPFAAQLRGTLLVASDGLLRYAKRADIARVVSTVRPLRAAAHELVALVQLPDGTLQDDVAVVLLRAL
jgi:serine/threonine protein phosphatase PrpC